MKITIRIIGITYILAVCSIANAKDCSQYFPIGKFGLSQGEKVFSGNKLQIGDYEYIYMIKNSLESVGYGCEFVATRDIFKLSYIKEPDFLMAGCKGDFDGDSKIDFSLILRHKKTDNVLPFVFLNRGDHYLRITLDKISDRYGFDEDKFSTPGPYCKKKPESGRLGADPGDSKKYNLIGDVITIGWRTYYWSNGKFESSWTSD
jgi:hypothetical protein